MQAHPVESNPDEWACPQCTLLNPNARPTCDACLFLNPNLAHSAAAQEVSSIYSDKAMGREVAVLPAGTEAYSNYQMHPNFTPGYSEATCETKVQAYPVGNAGDARAFYFDAEEDPLARKRRRRRRRRLRMAGGAVGGAIVGGVLLGPIGAAAGAVGAAAGVRAISKRGERLKDARVARMRELANTTTPPY